MASVPERRLPELTNAGLKATANVIARNEFDEPVEGAIAVERALTIYLDKREIVTLMTLGNYPELLILGWLRNQRLVEDISAIKAIQGVPIICAPALPYSASLTPIPAPALVSTMT